MLRRAGMDQRVDVLLVDEPRLVGIEESIRPTIWAYRATDNYAQIKSDPSIETAERVICQRVDQVIATSEPVASHLRSLSGRSVTTIENGVDLRHLRRPAPEHAGLTHLSTPRVVYVGAIDFRFDFPLVRRLAADYPGTQFVNYGPVTIDLGGDELPNLHFLGPLPYAALPSVLQHCDIGLLPMNDHPSNRGRSPMKYYEYLAAGLRVLVRRTPEIDRRGPQGAHLYETADEASSMLGAMISGSPDEAIDVEHQGWPHKAQQILATLSIDGGQVGTEPVSMGAESPA